MSAKPWYRNNLTGLPERADINQQDLQRARAAGCGLFCIRSFAAAAGYKSARYFEAKVLTAPGSLFHAVPIYDTDGTIVSWATATNSGEAGGKAARERANRARGVITDQSSGANR